MKNDIYTKDCYLLAEYAGYSKAEQHQLNMMEALTSGLPYPIGLISKDGYDDYLFDSQNELLIFLSYKDEWSLFLERSDGHFSPCITMYVDTLSGLDELSIVALNKSKSLNIEASVPVYCSYDPLKGVLPRYFNREECLEIYSKWSQRFYHSRKSVIAPRVEPSRIELIKLIEPEDFKIRIDGVDTPFVTSGFTTRPIVTMTDFTSENKNFIRILEEVSKWKKE